MKEKIKNIINQVFEEKGIKVEKIILFGLRARGEYRALSDEILSEGVKMGGSEDEGS
jgi:predicted nucleotidyltransferase